MSILGIDYGEKRVGLALAESPLDLPLPYKVLENKGAAELLAQLKKIVDEELVTEIVVGMPLTPEGELGPQAKKTAEFVGLLKNNLEVKIATMDERMTSRLAEELSQGQGVPRDVGAAMVILDDYLKNKSKGDL